MLDGLASERGKQSVETERESGEVVIWPGDLQRLGHDVSGKRFPFAVRFSPQNPLWETPLRVWWSHHGEPGIFDCDQIESAQTRIVD